MQEAVGSTNTRNMQLSLMTLQKQLAAVRAMAEKNSQAAAAKDAKLNNLETAGRQLAQLLLTEANLTLCIKEEADQQQQQQKRQQQLVSPADGVFRVELSGRVRTSSMFSNMKLFELRKNGSALKNGGVVRNVGENQNIWNIIFT